MAHGCRCDSDVSSGPTGLFIIIAIIVLLFALVAVDHGASCF
ncbi:MAG: hypothetical protein E6713_13300 [Sporomusaceae bacterium]|nr:hypothetical protein [Sporomusaceae bacterium]